MRRPRRPSLLAGVQGGRASIGHVPRTVLRPAAGQVILRSNAFGQKMRNGPPGLFEMFDLSV